MEKIISQKNRLSWLFILSGLIAFFFSFIITVEKIALVADPSYVPPCSINPLISCGNIMASWQASLFGFPNPLLGIAGFAIVTAIGFALLSGAQFKRRFWQGIQVGLTLATIFIYWLFFEAVFRIGSLCPYCMVVWFVTIPLFLYATFYNLKEGHLGFVITTKRWHRVAWMGLMYGIIFAAIIWKFWSYWGTFF